MTRYPLTVEQRRLWFLQQLNAADASYNMYIAWRWRGPLDPAALSAALNRLAARHEVLRTRFDLVDDQPVQLVEPSVRIELEQVDLAVPPGAPEQELDRIAAAAAGERVNTAFDLATAPLLRAALLRLGHQDQLVCLTLHHIVSDGWSARLLWSELLACYRAELAGREPDLPELKGTFGDYALAEQERLAGPHAEREFAFWQQKLAGIERLELPTDRPRPRRPAHRAVFGTTRIEPDLYAAVERFARQERCTPFMVLLAAYQVLLSRWSGQREFAVGTPIAGRTEVEHESLTGYFSRTAVIKADLSAEPDGGEPDFRTVLRRVRSAAMAAFGHQDVPVERLVPALGLPRSAHRPPLYQTLFVLQSQNELANATAEDAISGVDLRPAADAGYAQAKFDVLLDLWRHAEGGLTGSFCFDAELFDRATAEATAQRYTQLLRRVVADPLLPLHGSLLLDEAERSALLELGAGAALPAELPTVLERFAAQVAERPDAVALECAGETLGYAELDRRATLLAARLGELAGQVVGVRLAPSFDLVTALLALWKAGAGYLPLDAAHPVERLRFLLAVGGAQLVLAAAGDSEAAALGVPVLELPAVWPAGTADPLPAPAPGAPAYLLHTSGSTGQPKGVLVDHPALAARVAWMAGPDGYALGEGDAVVQFASIGFDTHAEELWPALAAGARCVLLPDGGRLLPDFLRTPAAAAVTVLDLPTAYWSELVALGAEVAWPAALRLVVLGGSEPAAGSVAAWRKRHGDSVRLVNTYGPTEATVIVTSAELDAGSAVGRPPLGRPLPGVRCYVLDGRQRLVPRGYEGELALGGAGLAAGYRGRPELTAAAFLADPFAGGRMYRTGDLVRWRADGQLEFLGRTDDQVKLHGRRIEPGEIEAVLTHHPAVSRAAVVVRDATRLVAYLVPRAGAVVDPAAVRAHLADRLPAFMVPAGYAVLDTLPLTPNGKLDRAALPDPGPDTAAAREFRAPDSDAEVLVAEIWQEVLGVARAGALDDFFALGGDSLLVTRVAARLRAAVGLEIQVRDVFEQPTLAALAARIEDLLIAEIDGLTDQEARQQLT
ncbi:non-ribosomal peptide synthetase [Streptomyces tateyamensis]|uniref:Non-ribosomal peptide synthetase n=1 Tax=Streptomyces tateyamensis TaxID=565073 RepID=A0A2V4MVW9_9ACTN|nr:non-ribosomal peptide synthetase [Streptomyces tateyamensis]PYC71878.1 non-ribosomal peptide synthetase [Streptomyces tateyamensis]